MKRHELSEAQWKRVKDLLPPERKPQGGRPGKNNREMAQCDGILAEYRYSLAGFARTVWPLAKCVQSISCMDKGRRMGERSGTVDPARYSR